MNDTSLKPKAVSGFLWKICERVAAQGVSFAVTVVLARLLLPEDYAPITLLTIFISIANIFIADGFCAALVQKRDTDPLDYSSVLIASIGLAAVLYAVLFFVAPFIAAFYEMPILTPTLRVLAIRIPLAAVNSVEIAYLTKNMRFRAFFWGTLIGTVASAFTGITAAVNNMGTWALVIQNLTNYTIDTIVLFLIIRKIPPLRFSMKRVRPLLQYGYKILLNSLFFTIIEEARSLIIGKRYTARDLAFYSKGHQFPQLISTCISGPMTSVMFPTMSAVNNDIGRVKSIFRKSVQGLTYVIFPLLMGLAAVSEGLIKLLLTDKWLFAKPFMIIFCFYYLLPPIHSLNQEAVKAIGRGDQLLIYGIIKRVVSVIAILVTLWFGPYAIAGGMVASALVAQMINSYQNKRLFAYTYVEQFGDWLPNFIIGAIMFVVVYVTGELLPLHYALVLCLQVVEGVVLYVVLSVLTRNKGFRMIFDYLREFAHKKRA